MTERSNRVDEEFVNKTKLYGRETPVRDGVSVLTENLPEGVEALVGIDHADIFQDDIGLFLMTDGEVKGENQPRSSMHDFLGKDSVYSRRIWGIGTRGLEYHSGFSTDMEILKEAVKNSQNALKRKGDVYAPVAYTDVYGHGELTFYARKNQATDKQEVSVVRRDGSSVSRYSLGTPEQLSAAIGLMEKAAAKKAGQK